MNWWLADETYSHPSAPWNTRITIQMHMLKGITLPSIFASIIYKRKPQNSTLIISLSHLTQNIYCHNSLFRKKYINNYGNASCNQEYLTSIHHAHRLSLPHTVFIVAGDNVAANKVWLSLTDILESLYTKTISPGNTSKPWYM